MAYGQIRSSSGRVLNLTPDGWINNEGENLNAAPGNALTAALSGNQPVARQPQNVPSGNTLADLLADNNTSYKNRINFNGREAFTTPDGSIVWQNADGSTGKATARNPVQDAFEREQLARQKERLGIERAAAELEQVREQTRQMSAPTKPSWDIIDTEQGKMRVDKNSGRMEPLGIAGAEKPIPESQVKGAAFATRAGDANQIIDTVGKNGEVQPGTLKRMASSIPLIGNGLGTVLNGTQSAEQQQVEQAQRNFINAVMRQESGAAIADSEFDNAAKQYFPQPGDAPAVIEQKRQNRERAISALQMQAGSAMKKMGNTAPAQARNVGATNAQGWKLHRDKGGNLAYVGPNGEIQEVN